MSQRDMQHQAAEDGGASAADGYSPAGEVPPPATRLLDLPPVLLDDIACWVMQLGARSLLPLTCRTFSLAHLLHAPALRIQLGRQRCDQLLTPRVLAALQARTSKLALTLWQPETEDTMVYKQQMAPTLQLPQTEYTQDYTDLLTHALAKLDKCAAVEVCRLVSSGQYTGNKRRHLHCPPGLAQHLLDSFPSLTGLTLKGLCVLSKALASLLSHPPLALQLQQLDIIDPFNDILEHPGSIEPGAWSLDFEGLQLKQLSIAAFNDHCCPIPVLPSFQPLVQHLTQLTLNTGCVFHTDMSEFIKYLQPLAQLQVLTVTGQLCREGLAELLQALPQLHTLQLPGWFVVGQQQLNTLLAATQITSLQLGGVHGLDASCADAPCSWQQLELARVKKGHHIPDIMLLPLHSLSQPLVLRRLYICVDDLPNPEVGAALNRLAQAIKVPVQIKILQLIMQNAELSTDVITPQLLRQQRVDLAQLVSLLQPLQRWCVGWVLVRDLHQVTAADVQALAPLCRDCTGFQLYDEGSVEPSLEFWRQLVQLMPNVTDVLFNDVEGSTSSAMHESLQLMAEQPWARWLDITIRGKSPFSELPLCWQAGSWVKAGIFKVTMYLN